MSLALLLCSGTVANANPITLAWDPSTGDDVAGYTVRYGTSPGVYSQQVDAGNATSLTLPKLPNGTYYFVVQAYSSSGFTSAYSNQLVVTVGGTSSPVPTIPTIPTPSPSGCSTPDPFAALGGGTCYSGAWLPPGMAPPTSTPAPSPSPSPSPAPAPSTGGCTTPDPFVAIGGGVCVSGGWIPAGMAPSAPQPSAPAPPPPAPSTPAPAPAPSTGGCTTPDPFVAIGGGVCLGGGWVPAGMAPSAPQPSTPTPPAPAPSTTGCTTPDPFVTIGGGACVNGGWVPAAMAPSAPKPSTPAPAPSTPTPSPSPSTPPPAPAPSTGGCTTPDPFVTIGGGACVNGGWVPAAMAPSAPTPAPAPSTPSTPPPVTTPPPPPSGGGACTTPDPFAALGGGTCYNGGWLPPGMAVPGGGSRAQSTPAPAPAQMSAPSSPTSCITPDPFATLGGGTCYNGSWLPPGMAPPDAADTDITVTGTLHVIDAATGLWMIEAEDGTLYTSESEVPDEILVSGAIVTLHGTRLPAENGGEEIIIVEIITIEIQK